MLITKILQEKTFGEHEYITSAYCYLSSIFASLPRNAHSLPTAAASLFVPGRAAWHERCTSKPGPPPLLRSPLQCHQRLSSTLIVSLSLIDRSLSPLAASLSLSPYLSLCYVFSCAGKTPTIHKRGLLTHLYSHLLFALLTFLRGSSDLCFVPERTSQRNDRAMCMLSKISDLFADACRNCRVPLSFPLTNTAIHVTRFLIKQLSRL